MGKIDSKQLLIRLVERYQNLIFSICLRLTGDYFVAEDIAQETFLVAYKHLEQCVPETEKAWLCRIASNKCIDYLRTAQRIAFSDEDQMYHLTLPDEEEPLRQILNSEILEELRVCCIALPPPYQKVAIAHFMDGKTAKEIAKESNVSVNTVKTQIYRSRELLKKSYRKELLQE